MNYIIDTHTLIWAIIDRSALSKKTLKILLDPNEAVYVSAISFWEISLKFGLGKLSLKGIAPEDLPALCQQIGFEVIPISPEICATYHQLTANYHRDPFDKMLIWQAIQGNYTLISKDNNISRYRSAGLTVLW